MAEGITRLESVEAGGDSDAVGHWSYDIYVKVGRWYACVECLYGVSGLLAQRGAFAGVELPGPIDFEIVEQPLGPFSSREEALSAVAERLLACTALLSGAWDDVG
jgi:hypothetical protein